MLNIYAGGCMIYNWSILVYFPPGYTTRSLFDAKYKYTGAKPVLGTWQMLQQSRSDLRSAAAV